MKNLYIYKMRECGEIEKEVWEDIKITRSEGIIVTKRDSNYRIAHGQYKYKDNLDRAIQISELWTEYITFTEQELTQDIKEMLVQPFIDKYKQQQINLQVKIDSLERLKKD